MRYEEFDSQLAALLRSAGPDTVAELTATMVAWWNGRRVVYAVVDSAGSGALTGAYELDANRWHEWKDWLTDWLTDLVLSVRHDLPDES
jgi:hypothetical protein